MSKKIAFYSSDSGNHRFITPIMDRLTELGYICQLYNNWHIDPDASILWFDFCDQNLISASKENTDFLKSKKVIARLHAVEYYMNFHHAIDWSCVGDLIFVSDHLRRMCNQEGELPVRQHVIHNGLDLPKLGFQNHHNGLVIGYAGNIVPAKGILTMFHYFRELRRWDGDFKLKMVGLNRFGARDLEFYKHYTKDLPIEESGEVSDIDEWLDGIDYLWQPSNAESFSMIIGEAMAKGIKPLINNFYGAEELWPKENIYNDFSSFRAIINAPYESEKYREFVERYSLDKAMEHICKILSS